LIYMFLFIIFFAFVSHASTLLLQHIVIPTEGQASWAVCSITEYRTALLP